MEIKKKEEQDWRMMQLPMAQVGHGYGQRKKSKPGEDGSYHTAHVSLIKGVVNVGVVLSLKYILKSW